VVAELRAAKMAQAAVPLAAAALAKAGFRVHPWSDGLAVDEAPGLSAELAGLEARGINPFVAILRALDDGDRAGGAATAGPATPRKHAGVGGVCPCREA
jgi:hypothetical protein